VLGERFIFVWMMLFIIVSLISGHPVDIIGLPHAAIIVFGSIIVLASASFPNLNQTSKDMLWILTGIASAAVVVFLLYSLVETFATDSLKLLSLSTTLELLGPVIAAAIVVGTIQVIVGKTLGPTTRELEYERLPTTISVSSQKDEQFLKAVQQLAEIWDKNPDNATYTFTDEQPQAKVTISVDDSEEANYTIEKDVRPGRSNYSNIISEISNKDDKWILRDSAPRYPDKVETTKFLQIKVLTDVSELSIKERIYLRSQAVKKFLCSSKT
jgi:hypothetical protein